MPGIRRPSTVPVADENGAVRNVSLSEWRTFVLPELLQRAWTEPEDLARVVECAIDAGAHADVLSASEQLSRIDPNRDRRYGLPAVVFVKNGQFRRADELLDRYASLYGETSYGLYARAEASLSGNRRARGQELLRESLRIDPDASRPLRRLIEDVSHDGADPVRQAVREIADVRGSWRSKLWLAADSATDPMEVATLVRGAIEQSSDEGVLSIASSVLARRSLTTLLVDLVAPRYRINKDRLACGINLLYAFLSAGQKVPGESLLQHLAPMLETSELVDYADFYRAAFRELREAPDPAASVEANRALLRTMAAAARQGSQKAKRRQWELLAEAALRVPVIRSWVEVPIFESPWPASLPLLEIVTGTDSEGRDVAIAFTDERTRHAWGPMRSPCVVMTGRALLEIVSREKGCSLLVNPAGPTATELSPRDIEAVRDGRIPEGEDSQIRFLAEPLRRDVPFGFIETTTRFLRASGIVRQAWLFEMVDDRSGINPAIAVDFAPDAEPVDARDLLIDGPDEVRWDSRRSRRVRFIPLEAGRLSDYLREVGVSIPVD